MFCVFLMKFSMFYVTFGESFVFSVKSCAFLWKIVHILLNLCVFNDILNALCNI